MAMKRTKYNNVKNEDIRIPIKNGILHIKPSKNEVILEMKLSTIDLQQCNLINNILLLEVYRAKSTEQKSMISSRPRRKEGLDKRAEKYKPLVSKLAKIICRKKNVNHTPVQLRGWMHEFRKLEENHGVSYDRMETVLKWYNENIHGEYVPVVESGYSFRNKFLRLEDAMNRKEYNGNSKKQKFIIDDGIRYNLCEDGRYRHCVSGEVYIP